MNKKILFTFLIAAGAVLSRAQASDGALKLCNSMVEGTVKKLKIDLDSRISDQIGQCVKTFVKVNVPRLHVLEHEEENYCGLVCGTKWSYVARTYDAGDYLELIEDRIDKEDLDKIEKVTGVSLKELVDREYNAVVRSQAERVARVKKRAGRLRELLKGGIEARREQAQEAREFGLPLLKKIILEFSKLNVKSQILDLKLEKVKEVQATRVKLDNEIATCLEVVTTEEGLGICADRFQENAVYQIGRYTLDVYLDKHFEERVEENKYTAFKDSALEDYDACTVEYFLNEEEIVEKKSDKILPCVFNALFESFIKIAESLVLENSKMSPIEIKLVVIDLVDQCDKTPFATLKDNERMRKFQNFSVEEFTEFLLSCQKNLTAGVVARVGSEAISGHPSVIEILGEEKAKIFAAKVLKEEVPLCFEKMGTEDSPEKCENYLFAKTASRIFPIVIDQKFTEFKEEYPFLTDALISSSKLIAESSLKTCQEEMYKDFSAFSNMDSDKAEVLTAKCLRKAILGSLEKVVDEYVKVEIQSNKVLKENGIEFGPSKKEKLKTDFFSCAAINIATKEGLKSVVETSSTFLDKCVVSLTKDVVLDTFGTIVLDNLLEVGLKKKQVDKVYKIYKESPDNLLNKVEQAKTASEIESVLEGAENKIIGSISQDVIKFLILNKAPVNFDEKTIEELSKKGSIELIDCLKTEDLSTCAVEVEKIIMKKALGVFLPEAIYSVFEEKLSDLISDKDFNALGLKDRISTSLSTTKDGENLKEFIIEKISEGASVEDIQEMKEVNDFVIKYVFKPVSTRVIRSIIINKSPVKFSKTELGSLVDHGKSRIIKCLESETISVCADKVEKDLTKRAVMVFLPKASYGEFKKALKGVLSESEIKSYGILSKIKKDISTSEKGQKLISYIADEISKGRSVDRIKSDKRIVSYITDIALKPIVSDIIRKLIIKKSPIKFSSNEMKALVSTGKTSLLSCLKKNEASLCADRAEGSVLRKAVVIYLPKAVNIEFRAALSKWFSKKDISAYGLEAKFTQSLTTGKVGNQIVGYIAKELQKGTSTKKIQKLSKVTSYVHLVLTSYKAPGTSGRMISQDISHRIIQKEINKFIGELNQGKHGGFFKLGFHVYFSTSRSKTAFKWSNSKKTKSGKLASKKFQAILKRVIVKGAAISDKDIEEMKELVKAAVLEHRKLALGFK